MRRSAYQAISGTATYLNAVQHPQRIFIREIDHKLDDKREIKNGDLANRLVEQAKGFIDFVRRLAR
jgi:hypothetical protein